MSRSEDIRSYQDLKNELDGKKNNLTAEQYANELQALANLKAEILKPAIKA